MTAKQHRIDSTQNETLKTLARLREKKHRLLTQRFLVEGHREIERAIAGKIQLRSVYFCTEMQTQTQATIDLLNTLGDVCEHAYQLSTQAFNKISLRQNPDGFLAEATSSEIKIADLNLPENPLIIVAENVEKPGNLGALIRSAVAAKADAVISTEAGVDFQQHNVIRNSQGLVFTIPAVSASNEELRQFLKGSGIQSIATLPQATTSYWDCSYLQGTAIIVGNESTGLSNYWEEHCDLRINIPVAPLAESLNVNIAATLCLFEAHRQRTLAGR